MKDPFVTGDQLKPFTRQIRQIIDLADEGWSVDIDNPVYGEPFQFYWALSHPDLLKKIGFGIVDGQATVYAAYYWLFKFSKLYGFQHGADPEMDVQLLELLEYSDFETDWALVERIDKTVESELGGRR